MTYSERMAMLRGAAFMREKIAQCIEANPRKEIQGIGGHVRMNIALPNDNDIEQAIDKWLDSDVLSELNCKDEPDLAAAPQPEQEGESNA